MHLSQHLPWFDWALFALMQHHSSCLLERECPASGSLAVEAGSLAVEDGSLAVEAGSLAVEAG